MKGMKLIAIAAFGTTLASCAVWHDRTVDRTATAPVPAQRSSTSTGANAASYTADYPRDERRAGVSEGGAGGAGGTVR